MNPERDAAGAAAATGDGDEDSDPLDPVVDAATFAARDAQVAAESASDTSQAAVEAAQATVEVARHAKAATATAVAAAASSTALLAGQTAAAVHAESVLQAADTAASAATARRKIASELPDDADLHDARQAATAVADAVAAEVVARSSATAQAASLVAEAVAAAAQAASDAAQSAAATVEQAADEAEAAGRVVSGSSDTTLASTEVVVLSTTRAADLAPLLRAAAALHRKSLAGHPLVAELRDAIARSELRLHYQPIYDLRTGSPTAVEALIRWQHPRRGLLTPHDFLDVAENHPDLVTPVGDWVLTAAVTQAASWRSMLGDGAPKMWVNISSDQLGQQHHLAALVEHLLAHVGLPAETLGLEVTERQLMRRAEDAAAELAILREQGISLAVDDFGTGYAFLDYLRRFTFDEIKIDRSFVAGLGQDRTDTAVTTSIIALARSLDLNVVAEGVETQDQYDCLLNLGCAMGQG